MGGLIHLPGHVIVLFHFQFRDHGSDTNGPQQSPLAGKDRHAYAQNALCALTVIDGLSPFLCAFQFLAVDLRRGDRRVGKLGIFDLIQIRFQFLVIQPGQQGLSCC